MWRNIAVRAVVSVVVLSSVVWGYPKGITGTTNKTGGSGCAGCHSGSSLSIVTITGPKSLSVGQTGTYTLTINSGTLIGCDIAASEGTLTKVTADLKTDNGELTHSTRMSGTSVQFTYTPSAAGAQTLYAVGARDSREGGWGHAPDFAVSVTPGQTTDVPERETPQRYALHQNFPNPFNPSTVIRFDLPMQAEVRLTVYNLLGEELRVLVNGVRPAGMQTVRFDAAPLPSGAYLYRLEARPIGGEKSFVETKKFVLLR